MKALKVTNMNKNRCNYILLALAVVLLVTFYGCSTGHDGDQIILEELIIKGTTTSYATDKGTIVFVSSNDPQVIVEAKEEETLPSGAAIVLVERALYANEVGAYGGDTTNVYCLSGTYLEKGVEKKLTETDKPVTLTIPNIFSTEYYEFILGYKPIEATDWQYTKLGDDGKAVVNSARFSDGRPSQFIVTTRHMGYCYTVFGIKPGNKNLDDINSITFTADPEKYEVTDNNEYTKDLVVSSLIKAEKTTSQFAASDLTSELVFYTSSSSKSGVRIDGKTASESVSLEKEFNGKYLHRISINRYEEQNFSKSGNLATYSITLGIKGINKSIFPPEFHIKSTIIAEKKVVYAGEGKIIRYTEGEDGPDGFPIDVAMTMPASGTVASISTSIVLEFSEAISWTTKEKKLISISNEQRANIGFSATVSDDFKIVTITPDKPLNYSSLHVVDIEAGILGKGTANYVKPVSFEFMTDGGVAAKANIKPGADSKFDNYYIRKPEFIIDFGKTVASIDTVKNSIRVIQGGEVVDYKLTFTDDKSRIASLTFPADLLVGESYSITMTNPVKDNEGLDIGVFDTITFNVFPDIEVVETTPANDAENVPADSRINIRISSPMALDSSTAKNYFSIKDLVTGTEFPCECSYDDENMVISLIPQGNLLFNRRYQVSIKEGIKHKQTYQKLGSYSFSFKTADSDYTIAVLSSVEGYHQNNVLPFTVFRDNPRMEVNFAKDLMDYNYASTTITVQKDGIIVDWQRTWEGNKLILTPPGNQLEDGAVYKISMSDVIEASDNSLVNPFVPQEFVVALLYGKGRPENPYRIYDTDDFEVMREYRSCCFMLMNDIDFSAFASFEPIGSDLKVFSGKLFGDGKEIKNLTILPVEDSLYAGLFLSTQNAQIASLTLADSCVVSGEGDQITGGIAGLASGGSFEYCVNKARIKSDTTIGGIAGGAIGTTFKGCVNEGTLVTGVDRYDYANAGGIVGQVIQGIIDDCENKAEINIDAQCIAGICSGLQSGEIKNCKNTGDITGYESVAGIVYDFYSGEIKNCKNSGKITGNSYVSGIAYETDNATVTECVNTGDVRAMDARYGYAYVSGIVASTYKTTVYKCCNKGNVTADSGDCTSGIVAYAGYGSLIDSCYNSGIISGQSYVGGILAKLNYEQDITIKRCYNTGNVSGSSYVGGIAGYLYYLSGGSVNSCYNIADVSGYSYVAGIIGYCYYTHLLLENCYFRGNVNRTSGSNSYFAAILGYYYGYYSGASLGASCFSTTDTKVLGTPLTTSTDLMAQMSGTVVKSNNYVFDVAQFSSQGYDTVIKGTPWGEGSTWNNETIWNFYSDKLPELKNMPEP